MSYGRIKCLDPTRKTSFFHPTKLWSLPTILFEIIAPQHIFEYFTVKFYHRLYKKKKKSKTFVSCVYLFEPSDRISADIEVKTIAWFTSSNPGRYLAEVPGRTISSGIRPPNQREGTRPVFDGNPPVITRLALTHRGNTTELWFRSDYKRLLCG